MYAWLDRLENDQRPFLVSMVWIPLESLHSMGQTIVSWIVQHLKHILVGGATMILFKLLFAVVPNETFGYLLDFVVFSHTTFSRFTGSLSLSMVLVLIVVYWLSLAILWTPELSTPFMIANHCLWVVILSCFCSYLGALQMPVFFALMVYCFIGFVYSLREVDEQGSLLQRYRALISPRVLESRVEEVNSSFLKIL